MFIGVTNFFLSGAPCNFYHSGTPRRLRKGTSSMPAKNPPMCALQGGWRVIVERNHRGVFVARRGLVPRGGLAPPLGLALPCELAPPPLSCARFPRALFSSTRCSLRSLSRGGIHDRVDRGHRFRVITGSRLGVHPLRKRAPRR